MELLDLKKRLNQYIKHKSMSVRSLEKMAGLSDGSLAKYLSEEKRDIYLSAINKILDACKDLNPQWLIIGDGAMIVGNDNINQIIIGDINGHLHTNQSRLPASETLRELEHKLLVSELQFKSAQDKISTYEAYIKNLQEMVEILKNK